MKNFLHFVLKYLYVIAEYKDDKVLQYKFNKWNPLAWAILLITCFSAGLWEGGKVGYIIFIDVVRNPKQTPKTPKSS